MALSPRLDLRQSQQLVMTPQLQQAIKLLQLSNLELADYVAEEVEKNPLLEMGEPGADSSGDAVDTQHMAEGAGDAPSAATSHDSADPTGFEDAPDAPTSDHLLSETSDFDAAGDTALDTNLTEDVYHHDSAADQGDAAATATAQGLSLDGGSRTGSTPGSGPASDRGLDQTLEDGEGLHDMLLRQVGMEFSRPGTALIATHIIDMVDDAGYVPENICEDVADRLGADIAMVDQVLARVQSFEPSGVGARNLQECLSIQLRDRDRLDPCMEAFLDNLDLVARQDIAALKRACNADGEDIADMLAELRSLDPKPGLSFGQTEVQPVVPDIFVTRNRAGLWTVELNSDTLPRVLMNNHYVAELETMSKDKTVKHFVSECVSNANWLVKALDQRAKTILKVSSALVKQQEGFFQHGVRMMKPMTLKDIAEEIDMHESTVSRVTSNKFLTCPRGLFELKYFFSAAISDASGGDAHSAEAVKHRIKEMIDNEDPKKILSDDKIVALMKGSGIDIARRTVAKYREAMRIPSSVQRRRQKSGA